MVLVSPSYCSKNGRVSSGENPHGHDNRLLMCRALVMIKVKNIYFLIAISYFLYISNKFKYHYYNTVVKFQIAIMSVNFDKKVSRYGDRRGSLFFGMSVKKWAAYFASSPHTFFNALLFLIPRRGFCVPISFLLERMTNLIQKFFR